MSGRGRPARGPKSIALDWAKKEYDSGRTLTDIARELGISRYRLTKELKESGFEPREREIQLDVSEVKRLYWEDGLSASDVGKRFSVSELPILRILKSNGGVRPIGKKRKNPVSKRILQKLNDREYLHRLHHEEGMTLTNISGLLGVRKEEISNRFKEFEIPVNAFGNWSSWGEDQLAHFVKSIHPNVERNSRKLLGGLEIDILSHEKKIAIEHDVIYYHSLEFVDRNYQLRKTKLCEEKGYRLYHVYDVEWSDKREIWKSILSFAFGKVERKIHARHCSVERISPAIRRQFLQRTHLQGDGMGDFSYGLFHEGNLVSVMVFSRCQFNREYEWELIRFATELNTQVVGGASKLFAAFLRDRDFPDSVITYADRRYSNGDVYRAMGFEFLWETRPNYNYFWNGKLVNKQMFRREKIRKLFESGKLKFFDPSLSERVNMERNGNYQVYDCGKYAFGWKQKKDP